MHVFCRDLSGNSLSITASTASDLAFAVADRTGVPVAEQRLIFGSTQLNNHSTVALEETGLSDGVTVNLVLRYARLDSIMWGVRRLIPFRVD